MKNKEMETGTKGLARDRFVLEKFAQGFSVMEVQLILEKNGFKPIGRARVYQILHENGVKFDANGKEAKHTK